LSTPAAALPKVVVFGRNQNGRVIPAAKDFGAGYYIPARVFTEMEWKSLSIFEKIRQWGLNMRWAYNVRRSGCTALDIGDAGLGKGWNYGMEDWVFWLYSRRVKVYYGPGGAPKMPSGHMPGIVDPAGYPVSGSR